MNRNESMNRIDQKFARDELNMKTTGSKYNINIKHTTKKKEKNRNIIHS